MADITMCKDHECPHSVICRRFMSKPDPHRQAYFVESPRDLKTNACDYLWKFKELRDTEKVST